MNIKPVILIYCLATAIFVGGCGNPEATTPDVQINDMQAAVIEKLEEESRELQEQADFFLRTYKKLRWRRYRLACVSHFLLALRPEIRERMNLHLLDFHEPFPFEVEKVALADIKAGHLNLLTAGLTMGTYRNAFRKIKDVHVEHVTGCTVDKLVLEFIAAYNEPMIKAIEKKTGKSLDAIIKEYIAENEKENAKEAPGSVEVKEKEDAGIRIVP